MNQLSLRTAKIFWAMSLHWVIYLTCNLAIEHHRLLYKWLFMFSLYLCHWLFLLVKLILVSYSVNKQWGTFIRYSLCFYTIYFTCQQDGLTAFKSLNIIITMYYPVSENWTGVDFIGVGSVLWALPIRGIETSKRGISIYCWLERRS